MKLPKGLTKRGNVYWADFRVKGQRVQKSLRTGNRWVAEELLTELRARTNRGDFGLLDNDYPVEDLKAQYLRYCRQSLKPETVRRYEYNLQAILPEMPRRVSQITVGAVLSYRESRLAAGVSPRTINMDVAELSAMLTWGIDHRMLADNPVKGVKALPHDHPREGRALTEAEVDRLLKASPEHWRDIWYALLVTGMRKSELANLTFSDIDWDTRELIVRRATCKYPGGAAFDEDSRAPTHCLDGLSGRIRSRSKGHRIALFRAISPAR